MLALPQTLPEEARPEAGAHLSGPRGQALGGGGQAGWAQAAAHLADTTSGWACTLPPWALWPSALCRGGPGCSHLLPVALASILGSGPQDIVFFWR